MKKHLDTVREIHIVLCGTVVEQQCTAAFIFIKYNRLY